MNELSPLSKAVAIKRSRSRSNTHLICVAGNRSFYKMRTQLTPQLVLPSALQSDERLPSFVYVDVGCSGGIAREWRDLNFIQAYAYDPLVAEIERLKSSAPAHHNYVSAWIEGPDPEPKRIDSWFARASCNAAQEILNRNYQQDMYNSGEPVAYSEARGTLDEFLSDKAVNFVKTDTDGFDYQALKGGERVLANAIGVVCEANFHAYQNNTSVWRDIDALLSELGFQLAIVEPVRYTRSALPGRFVGKGLADTQTGAHVWADCLYLRNPQELSGDHLIRLAVAAEIYCLPDVAAEALIRLGDEIGEEQVERYLDLLVKYSPYPKIGSYKALMALFNEDPHVFGVQRDSFAGVIKKRISSLIFRNASGNECA